jgi:dihydrodipicolinate synthase/N-acetylneuraminate lyase
MLSHDEKLDVFQTARKVAGKKPVLLTINEAGTREAVALAKRAAKAGADGLMVVTSPIYHTNPEETVAAMSAVAKGGDLPVMIYSNRLAYRVDVTIPIMEEAGEGRAICRGEGILRRHPPLDRHHQRLWRPV